MSQPASASSPPVDKIKKPFASADHPNPTDDYITNRLAWTFPFHEYMRMRRDWTVAQFRSCYEKLCNDELSICPVCGCLIAQSEEIAAGLCNPNHVCPE